MKVRWAALLTAVLLSTARADSVSFGVLADTPYRHWESENLPQLFAEMGRAQLAFAIHAGDIKGGFSPCSEAAYQAVHALFAAAPLPLIYTPGDNEWTDCDRPGTGDYAPAERLARLRQIFHADEHSLGQRKIRLQRQSDDVAYSRYRENVRWQQGPLMLLTLNVAGSRNNIQNPEQPAAEYLSRNAANLAWLRAGFTAARQQGSAGLVIVMHANPGLEAASEGRFRAGYADLLRLLIGETQTYPGQVLLVHGDTHHHRIDQPLRDPHSGRTLDNLTRLETYGSPFMGWVRVTADTALPRLFRFESRPYTLVPSLD